MRARATALVVITALVGQAVAQTGEAVAVTCKVEGYDVVLVNGGDSALPAETVLDWSVPFARAEGSHRLERALDPGRIVVLTGALGSSYLGTRTRCLISLGAAEGDARP